MPTKPSNTTSGSSSAPAAPSTRSTGPGLISPGACQEPEPARSEMGSCFSSSGSAGDDAAAGYGDERRVRRVWPSDDDGGEWDVDNRAAVYIAKFHRHQSGVVCSDCAADQQQQQTPAATAAQ